MGEIWDLNINRTFDLIEFDITSVYLLITVIMADWLPNLLVAIQM